MWSSKFHPIVERSLRLHFTVDPDQWLPFCSEFATLLRGRCSWSRCSLQASMESPSWTRNKQTKKHANADNLAGSCVSDYFVAPHRQTVPVDRELRMNGWMNESLQVKCLTEIGRCSWSELWESQLHLLLTDVIRHVMHMLACKEYTSLVLLFDFLMFARYNFYTFWSMVLLLIVGFISYVLGERTKPNLSRPDQRCNNHIGCGLPSRVK